MAADTAVEKRANLLASRARWGTVDRHADEPTTTGRMGDYKQDSIQQWLISINRVNEKTEPVQKSAVESLRRNASAEDDLVLGVEASIYGNPGARTVKEFLRSSLASSALPRWNSLTSAFSNQSSTLSVMDVLNLWSDDPEEVLLDLGFGVEEPDITGRIPARFINNQSQARGINLQVFLEAQKNRMDIENPDVRSRFRQLEVLHQVTTAFNSLVGGGSSGASLGSRGPLANMSPEAREKRKRMGMLLRRASKKTLSLARSSQEQPPTSPTPDSAADSEQPVPQTSTPVHTHLPEKHGALKRSRPSLVENSGLTPLVEEQGPLPESSEAQAVELAAGVQESTVRLKSIREARAPAPAPPLRKRSPGEHMESFELEEIQSFDEGSVTGSVSGMAGCIGESERGLLSRAESSVIRTNSCQSDSSGFLEEPFIPVASQCPSPGPELMKALNAMSSSTDSQGTVRGSQEPSPTTPTFPTPVFTLVPPACDPEGPASDPAEPTAPPSGEGRPVDAPTTEEVAAAAAATAVVREDSSTMGSSQCCQSPESVMCVDSIQDRSDQTEPVGVTGPTESSVVQEGGEQPSSESNNEQEQHVRKRTISAVLEPTLNEEGVSASDECLTGEVSTSDGVVTLTVSTSAVKEGAANACVEADDQKGAECVQEAKTHASSQGTQVLPTETSQPVVSHELEGRLVDGDLAPTEPSRSDGRPCLPGRSVSVQMRSSLAPISQTALWKGVFPDTALRSRDVTQRRESFSRRAKSEAEAHPTPQSLAVEIPELASAAPSWQSQDSSHGFGKFQMRSFSLDTGLSWEDGDGRLDGVMMAGRGTRWCQCQCLCCVQHGPHTLLSEPASSFPYSLDELEEMMRGVKRFRTVLTEVEERLGHEQASVYEDLSFSDREEVRDMLELRAAVKQEARELELQLTELVHHYDDSFKMKINKLLDEQSHLCSQLRINPSDRPHPEPASSRSVATQCSLLPETDTIDTRPPPSSSSCTTKQGKLDFVGFIQNLKNSLHRSISSDSLE